MQCVSMVPAAIRFVFISSVSNNLGKEEGFFAAFSYTLFIALLTKSNALYFVFYFYSIWTYEPGQVSQQGDKVN